MDSERLQRIEALYHEALALPAEERAGFVAEACGADEALRNEVDSLLRNDASSDHFMEMPAGDAHPSLFNTADVSATTTRTEQLTPGHEPPTHTALGTWGEFRLLNELGHGGFGRVYRAWDATLAREVALKVIPIRDEAHRRSVLREGQMLARVRHENVVIVHSAQVMGDEVGLTMELIKGRTLADIVRRTGPMSAAEAAVVGTNVCQALAAVHAAGLLHRDVKAHNVMRESGGRYVLMDFGAGRDAKVTQLRQADLSGTPLYLAPELFSGERASPASDLYSVGVLLFYLVTRKYPVDGASMTDILLMHSEGRRRLLSDVRPDLPQAFVYLVERALSARPDKRPRSAGAMLAELSEFTTSGGGLARPAYDARTPPDAGTAPPLPSGQGSLSRTDPSVLTSAPPRGLSTSARWGLGIVMTVLGIGLMGLLTTAHYNRTLVRPAAFADETLLLWWQLGFQSLIPSVVITAVFLLVLKIATATWAVVQRLVPAARRLTSTARLTISGTFARMTGADTASYAQAVLFLQILSVGIVAFVFRNIIKTFVVTVNDPDLSRLAVLDPSPANGILYSYRAVLSLLLAGMVIAWYRFLSSPARRAVVPRTTVAAGAALMLIVLLALELPYRLMNKSEGLQIAFAGQRCFQTGESPDERLLYCPDISPPRNPIVKKNDPRVVTSTELGRFFAPAPGTSAGNR